MISSVMKMNVAKDYESNDSNVLQFCGDKIRGLLVGRKRKINVQPHPHDNSLLPDKTILYESRT